MRASYYLAIFYSLLLLSFTSVFLLHSGHRRRRRESRKPLTRRTWSPRVARYGLRTGSLDEGLVSDSMPMDHLYLQLKRPAEEEQALEA